MIINFDQDTNLGRAPGLSDCSPLLDANLGIDPRCVWNG